jgi:hypothetical protein
MRTEFEISQIITGFRDAFIQKHKPSGYRLSVLNDLENCRTSFLGGNTYVCPECGTVKISYNSCRNRHCPKCQGFEREKWVMARKEDMLPVKYFHVVFTLPGELHPVCLANRNEAYSALFRAAWDTLASFAGAYGVQTAMVSILHTWNTQLGYHPHLHCIVPAGGITKDGRWKKFANADNDKPFLFPVKAMGKVFRAKYTAMLDKNNIPIPPQARKSIYKKDWVVYSKHPFCHVGKTVEYLGRYSHRVAITNRRIKMITATHVTFEYTDRKDSGLIKTSRIYGEDFLNLFCRHFLPKKFVRIRHYGFLAPSNKEKLQQLQREFEVPVSPRKREKIKWENACEQLTGIPYRQCPCCQNAEMIILHTLKPHWMRGPPYSFQPYRAFYNNPA